MRAHQPGSTPIDIPETVPNPAYTPAPAPAPERAPTKVPEKVPEKVISGIAEVTATSNGGLNPKLLISGSPFDRRAPVGLMSIAKAGTPQLACRSQTHMTGHFVPIAGTGGGTGKGPGLARWGRNVSGVTAAASASSDRNRSAKASPS